MNYILAITFASIEKRRFSYISPVVIMLNHHTFFWNVGILSQTFWCKVWWSSIITTGDIYEKSAFFYGRDRYSQNIIHKKGSKYTKYFFCFISCFSAPTELQIAWKAKYSHKYVRRYGARMVFGLHQICLGL